MSLVLNIYDFLVQNAAKLRIVMRRLSASRVSWWKSYTRRRTLPWTSLWEWTRRTCVRGGGSRSQHAICSTRALATSAVWCLPVHGIRWKCWSQASSSRRRMGSMGKTGVRHCQIQKINEFRVNSSIEHIEQGKYAKR